MFHKINMSDHVLEKVKGVFMNALIAASAANQRVKNNYFDGLPVCREHRLVFFLIMLAYLFEQMDNWNFGFIAPELVSTGRLTVEQVGYINSCYFVAMTIGGLVGGVISDFIGRRKTFLAAIAVFSAASVLNGLVDNFHLFLLLRSLTGFGVFCLMVTSQTYIAEMAPAESRGKWQGLVAAVGFSAVPVVGALCRMIIPTSPDAWRYIFYFGGLGLIGFVLGLRHLKESPRWLVSKQRLEEAEAMIKSITGRDIDLSDAAKNASPRENFFHVLGGMFRPPYLKRTLLLIFTFMLTVPAQFVFTNFAPTLFQKAKGFTIEDTLTVSTIVSIGVPVGCYLSSLVSDLGGRKKPLALLYFGCAVLAFIFGQLDGLAAIAGFGFFLSVMTMSSSFTLFSYTAESYPTRMRNTATGFHNGVGRFSVSAMMAMVPALNAAYGFSGVFTITSIMLLVPVLPILIWGMSTGGKCLEDIC